jgi:hypothetical protein
MRLASPGLFQSGSTCVYRSETPTGLIEIADTVQLGPEQVSDFVDAGIYRVETAATTGNAKGAPRWV